MASACDRVTARLIANDLPRTLRLGRTGLGPRSFPNGTIVVIALDRRFSRTPRLAFIVVVEERSLGAGDSAATIAIDLEAMLADQRTDTPRSEPDGLERIEIWEFQFGAGVLIEQIKRTPRSRVPFAVD